MKIGMVNKLTIMNRFVLHTLPRNITHLTVITLKTNINIDILKGGGKVEKSPFVLYHGSFSSPHLQIFALKFLFILSNYYENWYIDYLS